MVREKTPPHLLDALGGKAMLRAAGNAARLLDGHQEFWTAPELRAQLHTTWKTAATCVMGMAGMSPGNVPDKAYVPTKVAEFRDALKHTLATMPDSVDTSTATVIATNCRVAVEAIYKVQPSVLDSVLARMSRLHGMHACMSWLRW